MERLLTKKQLAEMLQVTETTITNYMRAGLEPRTKTPIRFLFSEYLEWQESQNEK